MIHRTHRCRSVTALSAASLAALVLCAGFANEAQASDRYGGVWHEGVATGAFVPLEAGMTFAAMQQYRTSSWDDLRITDFEIHEQGCPAEEVDLTASQWEEGTFYDELLVYDSLPAFETGLVAKCEEGMVLHDFERWNPQCEREEGNEQYIALFREGDCNLELPPYVELSDVWEFANLVPGINESGYEVVDFEIGDDADEVMAVVYGGGSAQYFETLDRPDFESEMIDNEGQYRLEDMEGFRNEETRYVSGLWNLTEARDEHEVGEVYGMFRRLLYMDQYTRKLEDFEVYPDVVDQRYANAISQQLSMPQAYGFAVIQGGDVVADGGSGFAVRPVDHPGSGVAMASDSVGVSASVTKLVTALGVIRYAEQQPGPDDWLDTKMVDVMPSDFTDFGAGVETVTLRDLVTQQSGLVEFDGGGFDWTVDQAGWRDLMKAWLAEPLETTFDPQPRKYQNIHFELLALIMEEVVLPPTVPGPDKWRTWVNDEVFAPVGIGPRKCYGSGNDARSYPLAWSNTSPGVFFAPNNWECAGNGTGIGMFWISPMDMAILADGIRNATVISSDRADDLLAEGQGLDENNGVFFYTPAFDTDANTIGEAIHSKNGGLLGSNGPDLVGMETITIMYDDLDHDDDGNGDYRYEIGHTELSVALTVNSTPVATGDPCPDDVCTRLFPTPWSMAVQALMMPEDW